MSRTALPEEPNADRRSIMRTFLALTGGVATSAVWGVGKTRAEEAPNEGELVMLGRRLETLMRERETAESLQIEAAARFEKFAPKGKPTINLPNVSIVRLWDCLIDPRHDHPAISIEDHWEILRHFYDAADEVPFATIKAAAEQSGYRAAVEHVKAIDLEIHDLASRAFDIQAASLSGARAQALALLALAQVRYGPARGPIPPKAIMTVSGAVVALTNREEAGS